MDVAAGVVFDRRVCKTRLKALGNILTYVTDTIFFGNEGVIENNLIGNRRTHTNRIPPITIETDAVVSQFTGQQDAAVSGDAETLKVG